MWTDVAAKPVNAEQATAVPPPDPFATRVLRFVRAQWRYYLICRRDNVVWMRHLGGRVGDNCELLINHFGSEPWLISIGDRVTIAPGTRLLTHDGAPRIFRGRFADSSRFGNRFGTIVIRDDCFVGADSVILPGVSIGPRSIVGAGSVVAHDVPADTVVAGVPARRICSLDEYIAKTRARWIPTAARDRRELRRDLTRALWGEER